MDPTEGERRPLLGSMGFCRNGGDRKPHWMLARDSSPRGGLTLRGTLARAWAHVRCVRPVLEPHVGPQRSVQRWPWGALGQKDKVDAQGGRMRRWLLCELFFFKKSASQALLLSDKCLFLVSLGGPIKKGRGVTAGAAGQFAPARRVLPSPSPFYSESLIATQPNAGS